ncbi:MAG: asparaginase domain-containing protein [Phycisphaerales bacterium]|jgi:L-asparaginase|nr:asparaginase domain-containing protein [Phycisphaerales bacterium]
MSSQCLSGVKHVSLLTTGGTIEKTYDPLQGVFQNDVSVLDIMLSGLELVGVSLDRESVMNKDSLDMDQADHLLIAETAMQRAASHDGVIIVHGTDTLSRTGETLDGLAGRTLPVPVVLTGAMRPWLLRTSDALQNLTEAILAVQLLDPGVYVCMHSNVLRFPGVVKNRSALRFERAHQVHSEEGQ